VTTVTDQVLVARSGGEPIGATVAPSEPDPVVS
jgi:hypothetical protein